MLKLNNWNWAAPAQNSLKNDAGGQLLLIIYYYSWKPLKLAEKPIKLAQILKEKLKQISWNKSCNALIINTENFVGILQIHEVEIAIQWKFSGIFIKACWRWRETGNQVSLA